MFTKICKFMVWLWVIVGIIASIVIGTNQKDYYDDVTAVGYVIIFGGIISTIASAALLGMLVEISENISESRGYLYEIKYKLNNSQQSGDATSNSYGSALSKLSAINNSSSEHWFCRECGTQNSRLSDTCKGCGKHK